MSDVMQRVSELPPAAKAGGVGSVVALGAAGAGWLSGNWVMVLLIVLAAAVVAAACILLYRLLVAQSEKRRAKQLEGTLKSAAATGAAAAGEAELKAYTAKLSQQFQRGVTEYQKAGKDLYKLPWYLMVGPPGCGKTEAMRHSEIGFPPALTDPQQGAGGTIGMNWWFTNHAVVLDLAGRVIMGKDTDATSSSEWKEFLELLKKTRPRCPINGMFLAVDIDTLIKDSAESLSKKASKLAQQLETIQRILDVRFPVYVVITKCDKITGFKEFFEDLNNPELVHQMMGWSNPAQSLDEPFKPELVDQHLARVRADLTARRKRLLADPLHSQDPAARRTDEVDALFAFPSALTQIGPRLRRFLDTIFVAGEWSPKPLFLRGIYFTSSMQEGRALDEALAKALGISVADLPADTSMRRDRALFLRDMFLSKAFKESGLVTSAGNVTKAMRLRRAAIMGAGIAAAVIFIAFSFIYGSRLAASIGRPQGVWQRASAAARATGEAPLAPLVRDAAGVTKFTPDRPIAASTLVTLLDDTLATAAAPLRTPWIFKPADWLPGVGTDSTARQQQAHRLLVQSAVQPLVAQSLAHVARPESWQTPTQAKASAAALSQLIRLHVHAKGLSPQADAPAIQHPLLAEMAASGSGVPQALAAARPQLLDVAVLAQALDPATMDDPQAGPRARAQADRLAQIIAATYDLSGEADTEAALGNLWPPRALHLPVPQGQQLPVELVKGVENFAALLRTEPPALTGAQALASAIDDLRNAQAALAEIKWPTDPGQPATVAGFNQAADSFKARSAEFTVALDKLTKARDALGGDDLKSLAEGEKAWMTQADDAKSQLAGALPEPPTSLLGAVADAAGSGAGKALGGADVAAKAQQGAKQGAKLEALTADPARAPLAALAKQIDDVVKAEKARVADRFKAQRDAVDAAVRSLGAAGAATTPAAAFKEAGARDTLVKELVKALAPIEFNGPQRLKLNDNLAEVDRQAAELRARLAVAPGAGDGTSLPERVLRAVHARRKTTALTAFFEQATETKWEEAVEAAAANADPLKLFDMDGLAWAPAFIFTRKFHPEGALSVFEAWKAALDTLETSAPQGPATLAAGPAALSDAKLRSAADEFITSASEYLASYVDYWTKLRDGTGVRAEAFANWAAFQAGLSDVSVTRVIARQRTHFQSVRVGLDATRRVPPQVLRRQSLSPQDLLDPLPGPVDEKEVSDVIDRWKALNRDPQRASAQWNAKKAEYRLSTSAGGRFLSTLVREGERLLGDEAAQGVENSRAVIRVANRLPLARGGSGSMSVDEVRAAAAAAATLATVARTEGDEAKAKHYELIAKIAGGLLAERTVTIRPVIGRDNESNAQRKFLVARARAGGIEAANPTAGSAGFISHQKLAEVGVRVKMPGGTAAIELSSVDPATAPEVTLTYDRPWQALELALSPDAGLVQPPAGIPGVVVPLNIPGTNLQYWVAIEFNPPLPEELSKWPSAGNWP
jgi:hypothetical protein